MTPNPDASLPANDGPPVDFEQLLSAAAADPEVLQELVGLYFDQARQIMEGLAEAARKPSARDVGYLAHKLVGASLACGMSAVVPALRELESRARNGDLAGADALMTSAAAKLELVRLTVQEYLAQHKKP
ncbi:MAG: Hpt domain-containing protein [Verrucomicrobiota bacterium]